MEEECDQKLPFQDVPVRRTTQGLRTSMYRKPTHTDRYIHFKSNHHPATKIGTMMCLRRRAEEVCSRDMVQDELDHLATTFKANGYPNHLRRVLRAEKKPKKETKEQEHTLYIPYVKGTSENLQSLCRTLNIK